MSSVCQSANSRSETNQERYDFTLRIERSFLSLSLLGNAGKRTRVEMAFSYLRGSRPDTLKADRVSFRQHLQIFRYNGNTHEKYPSKCSADVGLGSSFDACEFLEYSCNVFNTRRTTIRSRRIRFVYVCVFITITERIRRVRNYDK